MTFGYHNHIPEFGAESGVVFYDEDPATHLPLSLAPANQVFNRQDLYIR